MIKLVKIPLLSFFLCIHNLNFIESSLIPQMKMLQVLFSTEEKLFKNEGNSHDLYSKKKRVWIFVFIARIIELEEYNIDPLKCYEASLFLLQNQETLDILFNKDCAFNPSIEIEKSKFLIKLIKYCRFSLTNEQTTQLLKHVNVL